MMTPLAHSSSTPRLLKALAGGGAAAFVVGLFADPVAAWAGWLIGFHLLVSLALSGAVFLAFLAMAGGRWATPLQRVPEALIKVLPIAGLAGIVLLLGVPTLYEWAHPGVVEGDVLLSRKAAWFGTWKYALRLVVIIAVWTLAARHLVTANHRAIQSPGRQTHNRRIVAASLMIVTVALGYSLGVTDWLLSLEPHWFSTLYPLYHFAGMACGGLAVTILLILWLERSGPLRGVLRDEHLHDIGKLLFSFTLVWAYCWFCQYMLIWYTDMPEETVFYAARRETDWWLLVRTALVLLWAIPFLALMSRTTCRSRTVLGRVAWIVLVGWVVDLFVHVGPSTIGPEPQLGAWALGPVVGAIALFFLLTRRALATPPPPVPENDPATAYSLSYETN